MVYLGADHNGFALKEKIKIWLRDWGYEFRDLGAAEFDQGDDFPDFGVPVAREVARRKGSFGILVCRSGCGMDIVANKVKGVRCILAVNSDQVFHSRKEDQVNVLSLPADFISEKEAKKAVRFFLETEPALDPRYLRRIEKINQLEKES